MEAAGGSSPEPGRRDQLGTCCRHYLKSSGSSECPGAPGDTSEVPLGNGQFTGIARGIFQGDFDLSTILGSRMVHTGDHLYDQQEAKFLIFN